MAYRKPYELLISGTFLARKTITAYDREEIEDEIDYITADCIDLDDAELEISDIEVQEF